MAKPAAVDLLQGTLDMLVLKAVSLGPLHGYGVLLRIQQISQNRLEIQQGSLYPALYRLEHEGWIAGEWGQSENKRRARFYRLTRGRARRLEAETKKWSHFAEVIGAILDAAAGGAMSLRSRIVNMVARRRANAMHWTGRSTKNCEFHIESYAEDLMRSGLPRERRCGVRGRSWAAWRPAEKNAARRGERGCWMSCVRICAMRCACSCRSPGICGHRRWIAGAGHRGEYGDLHRGAAHAARPAGGSASGTTAAAGVDGAARWRCGDMWGWSTTCREAGRNRPRSRTRCTSNCGSKIGRLERLFAFKPLDRQTVTIDGQAEAGRRRDGVGQLLLDARSAAAIGARHSGVRRRRARQRSGGRDQR